MSNLSKNTKRLVNLYKDTEFKASFIANYLTKNIGPAKAEEEYVWAFGTITRSVATENSPALSSLSDASIKRVLLSMSESGLSFNPQQKHFYLTTEIALDGSVIPKVILGYLGMKKIVMLSGLVEGISNDIIYENDSFTWYGAKKEPSFASSTRRSDEDVSGGYVCLHMADGTVNSYRMSSEELLGIESNDIQMRVDMGFNKENSLYSGPWRERCLRIALWRCAFREFQHLFVKRENIFEQEQPKKDGSEGVDFSEEFANALNKNSEEVA